MLIAGASGHAKEILDLINQSGLNWRSTIFYDDLSYFENNIVFDKYRVITNAIDAEIYFKNVSNSFILALGGTVARKILAEKLISLGGSLTSIISKESIIGGSNVIIGPGVNIMNRVMVSSWVKIGQGTLINAFASIHHDSVIGEYCEVSPHAVVLGGCRIGAFSSIGSNATILPNLLIGENVHVGAGAVVTRNISDNQVVTGIPAKNLR